jgi:toxin ParE1/3/4
VRRLEVRWRREALNDLRDIYRIALRIGAGPTTAQRFVRRIRERCSRIGDAPHGGAARDDLAPGLRTVPFERRAVIAYLVIEDVVEITNVFYGGRDYEALYRGDDKIP